VNFEGWLKAKLGRNGEESGDGEFLAVVACPNEDTILGSCGFQTPTIDHYCDQLASYPPTFISSPGLPQHAW